MAGRDIKLAQAATLVERGEEWMGKPAHPTPRVKYTQAGRFFEQAADIYRSYGKWRQAAEAYGRAGDAEKRMSELLVCATYYVDAAECMERVDVHAATEYYTKAIGMYASMGRFMSAATLQMRVAELHAADNALTASADAYQYAADFWLGDDAFGQAILCLRQSGIALAEEEVYEEAHSKFERAARYALDDNLLKFRSPHLLFDAALCLVAEGDLIKSEDYIFDVSKRDGTFATGRERRFLLDMIDCAKVYDLDEFIDHTWNYDYVAELAPFELRMLEKIADIIKAGPADGKAESSSEEETDDDDDGDDDEEEETDDDDDGEE